MNNFASNNLILQAPTTKVDINNDPNKPARDQEIDFI